MKLILKAVVAFGAMIAIGSGIAGSVQADELDTIKEKGSIKIAMSGAYPPFNFINEENKVVGFDPSIGAEIAKRMGVEVEIVTTAWDGIIAGLLANKYDAIVGSMSITEKREKVVDFVGPYYRMNRAVFVRADSDLSGLSSLKGKKVGATLGETHEKWARTQDGWALKTYKGLPELMLELSNNRIDAFVTDDIPVLVAIQKSGVKIKRMDAPDLTGTADQAGIAIRKGNPKLAAAMQKALDEMQADGTYTKIAEQWIGDDIR